MMAAAHHVSAWGALICPGLVAVAVGPAAAWAWWRPDAPRRHGGDR